MFYLFKFLALKFKKSYWQNLTYYEWTSHYNTPPPTTKLFLYGFKSCYFCRNTISFVFVDNMNEIVVTHYRHTTIQTLTNIFSNNTSKITSWITTKILKFFNKILKWILHQIIVYFDKVKLVAGWNTDSPHPLPSYWIIKLTNEWQWKWQANSTTISPVIISMYILHPFNRSTRRREGLLKGGLEILNGILLNYWLISCLCSF